MSITIKRDIDDFDDLRDLTWECEFTLNAIENADLEENFMAHLEEIFFMNDSEIPTMTELNDYIRFETDTIFECLGLNEDGELEEEEEE